MISKHRRDDKSSSVVLLLFSDKQNWKTILPLRGMIIWGLFCAFGGHSRNTCFENLMNVFVSCAIAQNAAMTSASCCCCCCLCLMMVYSPRSTILPKRFLPRRKLRVEQFHRRLRNWCWHSVMAIFAPFAIAASTPGFSRASRRCFRLSVAWIAGSI